MRNWILILAIGGGLVSAGLGAKWISKARDNKPAPDTVIEDVEGAVEVARNDSMQRAGYFMILCLVTGTAGGFFAWKGQGKVAATILITSACLPMIFAVQSVYATVSLFAAGVLAIALKDPEPAPSAQVAPGAPAATAIS
jgi:hypothetical protein